MSQYTEFWEWFKTQEQTIATVLESFIGDSDNAKFLEQRDICFEQISKHLDPIDENLCFCFGPKDNQNKIQFYISANGIIDSFGAVIELCEQAPELQYFAVVPFRQAVDNPARFNIRFDDELVLSYDEIKFRYLENDNKIDILLTIPGLSTEEEKTEQDYQIINATFVLLDNLLGEYDVATLLGEIDFIAPEADEFESEPSALILLKDVVDNFKESLHNSSQASSNEEEFVCPSDEEINKVSSEEKLELAKEIMNNGLYAKSLELLASLKADFEDSAIWNYRYAVNLMHSNQFKQALEAAKRSYELDKTYPWGYLIYSQLLYWQNDFIQAVEVAKAGLKVVTGNPDDEEEFTMVLRCMYERVDFCDPNNFENSVLLQDFENYDDQADAEYRIGDVKSQWEKYDQYHRSLNKDRPALDFYVHVHAPLQLGRRNRFADNVGFALNLNNLGEETNRGTFEDEEGNPETVDFNFDVYTDVEDYEDKFLQSLHENIIPKGTELVICTIPTSDDQEPEVVKKLIVGDYDLACLVLDNSKVSEEDMEKYTYQEAIEHLFDNIGQRFYTAVDKNNMDKTYIYFATKDFHNFAQHLKAAVSDSVFSKGSLVFNATSNIDY